MIQNKVRVEERGSEVLVNSEGVQDTTAILMLNKFLRSLPKDQRGFFKECKIVGFMPVYQHRGDFRANETAYTLDDDQVEWFFDRHPEYLANDKTKNVATITGQKIISTPNA